MREEKISAKYSVTIFLDTEVAVSYGVRAAATFGVILKYRVGIPLQNLVKELPFLSKQAIRRNLSKLLGANLIEVSIHTPETVREFLFNKAAGFNPYPLGPETCKWCGIKTFVLDEHHFPISKKEGGKDTVKICPNCHKNFHLLLHDHIYKVPTK